MHFIACTCQPFSVVEHPTFASLLSSDPSGLKDRQHYSDRVMPRVYDGAKNAVKEKLSKCGTLSFTSDIWTNQSSGFISLTAHGINEYWQREQFVLCVREFGGSHTGERINEIVSQMLNDWSIEKKRCHVFVRDSAANMKKAFEVGGYKHADCAAHKINRIVKNGSLKRANCHTSQKSQSHRHAFQPLA
uniref:Transposase n=1 Tax=Ditylenchus dipsaci TaxID=166011 RepID=A0A915EJ06_9BILA